MKVAIDCDSNGVEMKKALCEHLRARKVPFEDLDYMSRRPCDYPDVAVHLAERIAEGAFDRGILICGTGQGMAMCANKVPGIFAGPCMDVYSAERLRKSNNAQILALGAKVVGIELAKTIVDAWLASEFEGGRSQPKVERMRALEREIMDRRRA